MQKEAPPQFEGLQLAACEQALQVVCARYVDEVRSKAAAEYWDRG
mgnify:CR=1 FL=1